MLGYASQNPCARKTLILSTSSKPMIALIAHDQKKEELVEFVIRHRDVFERRRLVATGSTGQLIGEAG